MSISSRCVLTDLFFLFYFPGSNFSQNRGRKQDKKSSSIEIKVSTYQLPSLAKQTQHQENSFNLLPVADLDGGFGFLQAQPQSFSPNSSTSLPSQSSTGGPGHYSLYIAAFLCCIFLLTLLSSSSMGSPGAAVPVRIPCSKTRSLWLHFCQGLLN